MRVYYRPETGRPMRVVWALEVIGAPYETVALSEEDMQGDAHLARHPLGRVPALEDDDGTTLFETTALLFHLADRFPDAGLLGPLGSADRGLVYQWSITAVSELESEIVRFLVNAQSSPDVAADAAAKFHEHAAPFEAAVAGRTTIVGDRLTVADIVLVGVLLAARLGDLLDEHPALTAYLEHWRTTDAVRESAERTESLFRAQVA